MRVAHALTFCGQFTPDREHVAECLIAGRRRLSVACRATLRGFE
jgi:hypothetical protein